MSKIKNGGLDQYGIVLSLNGIGGERVNILGSYSLEQVPCHFYHVLVCKLFFALPLFSGEGGDPCLCRPSVYVIKIVSLF